MEANFFDALPVYQRFEDLFDSDAFIPAPDGWHVVVTDIRGATEAIAQGGYRYVNLVGASTITATLNAAAPTQLPFSFGGDGATLLVPECLLPAAADAAHGTRRMAEWEFGLDLRVGSVSVKQLRAHGCDVQVARLQLADECFQTMFSGGGIARAEDFVKDEDTASRYALPPATAEPEADFSGLECRWNEIPSPHDENLTLLVKARSASTEERRRLYRNVLAQIKAIYGAPEKHRPLTAETLLPSFSPGRLHGEARVRTDRSGWARVRYTAKIWFQNVLLDWFVKRDVETEAARWRDYIALLVQTSDYRKHDDMLRMVLAGSADQRRQLLRWLDTLREAGALVYGHHRAEHALITCMVFERMGQQIHFVDGARGGYAEAAKELKAQLADVYRGAA